MKTDKSEKLAMCLFTYVWLESMWHGVKNQYVIQEFGK